MSLPFINLMGSSFCSIIEMNLQMGAVAKRLIVGVPAAAKSNFTALHPGIAFSVYKFEIAFNDEGPVGCGRYGHVFLVLFHALSFY